MLGAQLSFIPYEDEVFAAGRHVPMAAEASCGIINSTFQRNILKNRRHHVLEYKTSKIYTRLLSPVTFSE